ncbi:hypothetical protein [Mesorhizobium sp. 10.2.3]|uniref:hypothetical protein n=1 Tax=Mesorhizobium sp. 10.2.3 TaxID=1085775 RepID=UPI0010A95983|nr:hypothetical protein [Mesorhizobium sp. 10.2.3]
MQTQWRSMFQIGRTFGRNKQNRAEIDGWISSAMEGTSPLIAQRRFWLWLQGRAARAAVSAVVTNGAPVKLTKNSDHHTATNHCAAPSSKCGSGLTTIVIGRRPRFDESWKLCDYQPDAS